MAFKGTVVVIPTGGTAVPVCNPLAASLVQVQNLGNAAITLCGPGGTATQGVVLPANMTLPVAIAVAHYGAFQDADDQLYGCTTGVSAGTIGVLQPY